MSLRGAPRVTRNPDPASLQRPEIASLGDKNIERFPGESRGPSCATHGIELGGASPLRAARSGTDSQKPAPGLNRGQLRRSDAGWGGSRRQIGGPTNRNRIQGQCGRATRRWTGTPNTPSVTRTGKSGGHPEKVQCLTVGGLLGSPDNRSRVSATASDGRGGVSRGHSSARPIGKA